MNRFIAPSAVVVPLFPSQTSKRILLRISISCHWWCFDRSMGQEKNEDNKQHTIYVICESSLFLLRISIACHWLCWRPIDGPMWSETASSRYAVVVPLFPSYLHQDLPRSCIHYLQQLWITTAKRCVNGLNRRISLFSSLAFWRVVLSTWLIVELPWNHRVFFVDGFN